MGLFSRKKGVVGLDIGSSVVKLVELEPGKSGHSLKSVGYEPLPPEAIVDGAIMDATTVAEAIRKIFIDRKVRTENVATAVSGHSVIIKRISIPTMSPEELSESIQWEAEQYIPFDIDEVSLDYQVTLTPVCSQPILLSVSAKKPGGFSVLGVTLDGGPSDCDFDYRVSAKRLGYEDQRLAPVQQIESEDGDG